MAFGCRTKKERGSDYCLSDCPARVPHGVFRYVRVEQPTDLPPFDQATIDVAILDMNHGWPNLGHDSLVHAVLDTACDLLQPLEPSGLSVRAISFDVRRSLCIPEPPGGRFALYVGTGGPGHLDPRGNDGVAEGSQGITEDPAWEKPLFALFDRIRESPEAALLSVCHSFGLMCRWAGVARPVLRGPEKGGKSSGLLENVLTPEAMDHPWFGRFGQELRDGRRLRIVDNRLFDLIPDGGRWPDGFLPIGYETREVGGPPGSALTMMEFARDAEGGVMPRVFGVNHHPEIVDRGRQLLVLEAKRERGEVTEEWYRERREILTRTYPAENSDLRLHLTSEFTLLAPLRFYLLREIRRRASRLGRPTDLHEDMVVGRLAPAPA
jgi:hypothetical protein